MFSPIASIMHRAAHRRALQELTKLDDRMLRDIGLTRTELAFLISGRGENGGRHA